MLTLQQQLEIAVKTKELYLAGIPGYVIYGGGDIMWLMAWVDWAIEEQMIREQIEKAEAV